MSVEQLDLLLIQKNNEREAQQAALKAEILLIQEVRDRKRASVTSRKKFEAMSPEEQDALAQIIKARGIRSQGKIGTPR